MLVSWKLLVFIQVAVAFAGLSMMESTAQEMDCNYSCLFREYITLIHVLGHVHVGIHVVGFVLPIRALVMDGLKWGCIGRHTGRGWYWF